MRSFIQPQRLLFGLLLVGLILVAELVIHALHVPAWPAFMIMVFFFLEHMNPKKAPDILIGGLAGIACILLAQPVVSALAPWMGAEAGRLAFIVGAVYSIVVFGEILPRVFNNYAFMFLTVSALGLTAPNPNPPLWMLVEIVGGSALVAGVLAIGKLMAAFAPASPAAEAGH